MVMLISLTAAGQDQDQKERLKSEAQNFLKIYNTGDSVVYRNFLSKVIQDEPLLENTLMRYGNTYRSIGEFPFGHFLSNKVKELLLYK